LSLELVKLQLQLVKLRLQLLGPLLLRLQPHLTFVTIYELGYPHPDEGKSYDNGRYPHQRLSHMTLRRMVPEWHTLYPNQTIDKKILPFATASLAGSLLYAGRGALLIEPRSQFNIRCATGTAMRLDHVSRCG
jgi:hypothetical protein